MLSNAEPYILVTGAAGFIGSHLCEALLGQDIRIIGLDNLNDYYDSNLKLANINLLLEEKGFQFAKGDIRDSDLVSSIFQKWNVKSVVHLAAMVGVRNSIDNPQEYVDVNIGGLTNVLMHAAKHNVTNFIFASSSSVYGNRSKVPFKEDDITDFPFSPYAATKKAGESLVYTFHSLYGIPSTCLRFFTVYGPRGRPDMATYKFISRIHKGLAIPQFGDGTSARDYTYVLDTVKGIVASLNKPHDYEIYNLGGSHPVTLSSYIHLIEKVVGKEAIIEQHDDQMGDVVLTYADISKAQKDLGYRPSYDLEKGLEETFKWYLARY